ncbi:MAG: error-prone DNA polymerase [Pseudomonadota bacterium]
MTYVELFAISNFTFLTGASHAEELVTRARKVGLGGLAITDKNTFAGIVRGHSAAKELGLRYLVGTRLVLMDETEILAYPRDRKAFGQLSRLLTLGKRRTVKGQCELRLEDVLDYCDNCILIGLSGPEFGHTLRALKAAFDDHVFVGLAPRYDGSDPDRFAAAQALADRSGLDTVALGNVIMHAASRLRLADILSCIREKTTIDRLGRRAQPNAERRIKSEFEIRRLFHAYPNAVANTARIAEACPFSLDELRYEYPDEITDGLAPNDRLRKLTEEGLVRRYPDAVPLKVRAMVEKELRLIGELDYARYFLTVHDVVTFARSKGILCQGRGSAANSVVCYALGITEASPDMITMVFERFISEARNEPPDIDVDFEHERREEVIQHIYEKYGRHRAGLCSTVIHYRSRSAIRQVGQAMGLSVDVVSALSSQVWGVSSSDLEDERAKSAGLDLEDRRLRQTLDLAKQILGFPRHLSQHVGGFVITKGRLDELCPIENAAMADRTVLEWDKDDIEALGMLKIDVLALGMLTCIRKCFDLLDMWKGERYTLATLPQEDPMVYDMLCEADTIGVFQVESRAQMNFLPRMRPRTYQDLIAEVAIIRPGPIQGNMVHPYLRRRRGEEEIIYPSEALREVLERTYGVPLFQEQAMQIAIVAAGFTATEADALRRALNGFRRQGAVEDFKERFLAGCLERGYEKEFTENCFKQLEGFSSYGFPESHAASFALLVYVSSWIKCHHPDVFCCGLLNAQPMGFYAPAQIVRDARQHGVTVLPVCAEHSFWDNVLEPLPNGGFAVRLGFRQIKGFAEDDGHWIAAARGAGYGDVEAIWRRAGVGRGALTKLAGADAFAIYGLERRDALWSVKGLGADRPLPLFEKTGEGLPEADASLPMLSLHESVFEDYVATRLTLRDHPVNLLRNKLPRFSPSERHRMTTDGAWLAVAGLVITRQRPGTASGVIFLTLEDDAAVSNVVVWPKVFAKFRKEVMAGRLLHVRGKLQREGTVTHVIATHIVDYSYLLDGLGYPEFAGDSIDPSRDNADEAKRPVPDMRSGPKSEKRRAVADAITAELQEAHRARIAAGVRHPREQAKKLFYSRDFH